MKQNYTLDNIKKLDICIKRPSIVFLYGDLWVGKTTLSSEIISRYVGDRVVTSPTYIYYKQYKDIYHFDLYRMSFYDEFISIGGEEIIDNNEGIILIEWPQILEWVISPDIVIKLEKWETDERKIEIEYL